MLERLAPGDGLEIHLGQLVGGWVVYLDRASGPVRAPMHNRVGLRAPAHLTGCGKAALALLPPAEVAARVEAVCAAESRHLPDLAALARELDGARRAGFVVSDTFQPGRTSVAAPIPDPAGAPAGGISVAGPTPLLTGARVWTASATRWWPRPPPSAGAWPPSRRLGADRGPLVGRRHRDPRTQSAGDLGPGRAGSITAMWSTPAARPARRGRRRRPRPRRGRACAPAPGVGVAVDQELGDARGRRARGEASR